MPFIATYNPNNPNIFDVVKSPVECLQKNNVSLFGNIKMIQNKRHAPNLEEILPRAELQKDRPKEFNRTSERSECCSYLMKNEYYFFQHFEIGFQLKM